MGMTIEQIIKYLLAPMCSSTVIDSEEQKEYEAHDTAVIILRKYQEIQNILDKIRAEIEQLRLHKAQYLTSDNKVCIDSQDVFNVIDKYKAEIEQEPKTGHWIIIDDCELFMAKCSECGEIVDSRMISKYPYCHCGAKMVEPQESEGKE